VPPASQTKPVIVYFGQIRPDKGLEAFVELARLSWQRGEKFRFEVIGAFLPKQAEYLRQLQEGATDNLEWVFEAPFEDVAVRMSSALAAYLPFPDGASYRRGSLIGALVNGLPVITSCSDLTPEPLSRVIMQAEHPEEALECLRTLEELPWRRSQIAAASRALGKEFSWSSIAEAHELLYQELVGNRVHNHRVSTVSSESVEPASLSSKSH
jgi:glycosyltransferase involved in cell wall biosynthesis